MKSHAGPKLIQGGPWRDRWRGLAHTQSQSLHPSPPGTALRHRRKGEESGTAVPLPAKPQSNLCVHKPSPHPPAQAPGPQGPGQGPASLEFTHLALKESRTRVPSPYCGAPPRAEPQLLLRTPPRQQPHRGRPGNQMEVSGTSLGGSAGSHLSSVSLPIYTYVASGGGWAGPQGRAPLVTPAPASVSCITEVMSTPPPGSPQGTAHSQMGKWRP